MLNKLYGDEGNPNDAATHQNETEYGTYWAVKTFEKRVKNRIEFNNNYCFNMFFWIITSFCCCFRRCCNRMNWIRKGSVKYSKFQLALERLSKEHDI